MRNALDLFAETLRAIRAKLRLTQAELAEQVNMSTRTIIEIEGRKSSPHFETVETLARHLNISLDAMVFQEDTTGRVPKCVMDYFADKSEEEAAKYIALCKQADALK